MIETKITHAHTYCRFIQKKQVRYSKLKLNQKCKTDSDTKKISTLLLARGSEKKIDKFIKKKINSLMHQFGLNYFVNTVLFIYPLA